MLFQKTFLHSLNQYPLTITTNARSVSQCPVELSDDPPYSHIARNAWFGSITGDSARYDENYYNQFKYFSESTLFNELKRYPVLLAMNDSADESFQNFYEERLSSNYAFFDSVEVLVKNDLFSEALQLVEGINDTNDIEFCLKNVFQLYLNSRINGVDFTSQDSLLLDSIAELNAITTGPGVIMARILLNKEKYDFLSSGSRLVSPIKKDEEDILDIYVYPNPTSNLIYIVPTINSENISIYIKDITGRILLNKINQLQIETSTLTSGIYLLEYEAQGQRVVKKFEIIK